MRSKAEFVQAVGGLKRRSDEVDVKLASLHGDFHSVSKQLQLLGIKQHEAEMLHVRVLAVASELEFSRNALPRTGAIRTRNVWGAEIM